MRKLLSILFCTRETLAVWRNYGWVHFHHLYQRSTLVVKPIPVHKLRVVVQLRAGYLDDARVILESRTLKRIQNQLDAVVDVGGVGHEFGRIIQAAGPVPVVQNNNGTSVVENRILP